MAAKTPIRTVYDGSTATGLAEFQTGEFIAVEHGGTGNTSLTANSLLLGNGTSAITASTIQISSNTISSSDADTVTIDENLDITGNLDVTGNVTIGGTIDIGDSSADTLTITATLDSNLIPDADSTRNIGSSSKAWANAYLDTITLGGTAITSTAAELNLLDGVTATTAELNLLDGVTATTAELNILDGVTATTAELNLLDGVTATTAEINYLDGVTSSIQTQIDNIDVSLTLSADSGTNDTFTTGSTLTFTGGSNIGTTVSDDTITIALDANPSVTTLTTSGNATVGGNLDVTGNVTIGGTIDIGDSSSDTLTITASLDSDLLPDADSTRDIGSTSKAWANAYIDAITGNLTGNVTGNVTGNLTGDVTGNADTATTLETARTIAGQSFDGSANITIAATDLSDTNQSLSTSDSVSFTTVTANLIGNVTGNLTGDVTGDVTGNLTGDVTGTVSDVSNHDTDDISEGATNQYFTTARARGSLSASGDVSYNSSTGVISFSETYSTAAELLTAIKTVDGSGSGLDADTLDGLTSGEFLTTSSVSPTAFASTSATAYATSDYGNLTNDTGTAGFVNEPIRATAYQDLALPGTTVSVDFGDLS